MRITNHLDIVSDLPTLLQLQRCKMTGVLGKLSTFRLEGLKISFMRLKIASAVPTNATGYQASKNLGNPLTYLLLVKPREVNRPLSLKKYKLRRR